MRGVALLRAKAAGQHVKRDSSEVQAGINIGLQVLEAPIGRCRDEGVEGSILVGKIIENGAETDGFDEQSEQFADLIRAGIIALAVSGNDDAAFGLLLRINAADVHTIM